MDIAGIRETLHREPFEPFVIRLADGRSLEVKHSDFVAVSSRRIVVIADDEVGSWSVIEPILIVSLDSLPKPRDKGGNGTHRKKPKA